MRNIYIFSNKTSISVGILNQFNQTYHFNTNIGYLVLRVGCGGTQNVTLRMRNAILFYISVYGRNVGMLAHKKTLLYHMTSFTKIEPDNYS